MASWRDTLRNAWLTRGVLARLLWPLSQLYAFLRLCHRALQRRPARRFAVPVVVVGNVCAGGTGKTPIVIALVEHLKTQGWRPGVVSRGYGRASRGIQVLDARSSAQQVGDEPRLIWQRCTVPVCVGERRADAVQALLDAHPDCNVILSDDGLQHLALERDIEIVVFDDRWTGNGYLLPAGPLREPWPRHFDFLLCTGNQMGAPHQRVQRHLATHALRADGSRVALASLAAGTSALLALAAIAQPEVFFNMLRACALRLQHTVALPDHGSFAHWQAPAGVDWTILCTEKDATKLWALCPQALAVPLECHLPTAFLAPFDRMLAHTQARLQARGTTQSVSLNPF